MKRGVYVCRNCQNNVLLGLDVLCLDVCYYVCMSVPRFILGLVRFGQLLRFADKRVVDITKMYTEIYNMKVEVDTFATDVFSHGQSFQHIPVR